MSGSFTIERRAALKSSLLEFAGRDLRLSGVAVTGSAASGKEDRWSDIDLAFGVTDPELVNAVVADFTNVLYGKGAIHHHDLRFAAWLYRVFFLPGGLQVDLAFVAKAEFRPLGPDFHLISGEAKPVQPFPVQDTTDLIGWAWLHALHARSCILRGKLWQAEYMLSAVRDHTLALACIRLGLPSAHGRGMDSLPESVKQPLLASLVGKLCEEELWRGLTAALEGLVNEVTLADPGLGERVAAELRGLYEDPRS